MSKSEDVSNLSVSSSVDFCTRAQLEQLRRDFDRLTALLDVFTSLYDQLFVAFELLCNSCGVELPK